MAFQPRGCTQRVSHQQWAYTSCSTAGLRAHQIVRPNVSQSQAENTRKKWKSACSGVRSCAWYLRPLPIAVTRHTPYKTADAAHRLKTYKTIVSSAYVHRAMGSRATRLGSPHPHLHRDWAHPAHICSGTGPPQLISHRIRFSDVAMNNRPMAEASGSAARHPCRAAQQIVVDGLRRAAVSSRAEHNRE